MTSKPIELYECDECTEHYDSETKAENCCNGGVSSIYVCPECESEYLFKTEAESCCDEGSDAAG
jgi:uncharacterized protein YlaI